MGQTQNKAQGDKERGEKRTRRGRGKERHIIRVQRLPTCPHVEITNPVPSGGFNVNGACEICVPKTTGDEYYLCLYCYKIHCGRQEGGKKHFRDHFAQTDHMLVLNLTTLTPKCLACDDKLLPDAHENITSAINAAFRRKFGVTYALPSLESVTRRNILL